MNKKILATTGFARSGKNTLANFLQSQITQDFPNLIVKQFSFAYHLRVEINDFLIERFNISAFTEDPKEKEIIRHMLIGYGNAKRAGSNNKYWIEKLEKQINESDCDVALITDLRFAENDEDELGWLKSNKGNSIHIRRFSKNGNKKVFEKAPNQWEQANEKNLIKGALEVFEIERYEEEKLFNKQINKLCLDFVESNLGLFV